jgi:hypothetical protein
MPNATAASVPPRPNTSGIAMASATVTAAAWFPADELPEPKLRHPFGLRNGPQDDVATGPKRIYEEAVTRPETPISWRTRSAPLTMARSLAFAAGRE